MREGFKPQLLTTKIILGSMMLKESIEKLIARESLDEKSSAACIEEILTNKEIALAAAFLTLLRAKGENANEVQGIVRTMRQHMIQVRPKSEVLDIVGTGGDGANTVNISTGASLLAAASGVAVAKHGNRSVSSRCGSADLLESCGIKLSLGPEEVAACIDKLNIGFMFAPAFHPAMKVMAPIRRSLGIKTVFNIIGPLLNPAQASFLLLGVWDRNLIDLVAKVLMDLGTKRAYVFHSCGLDELSPLGKSEGSLVESGKMTRLSIDPKDYDIPACELKDLQGGGPEENKSLLLQAFITTSHPISHSLKLNAGLGLWLAGKKPNIKEAIHSLDEVLEKGLAIDLLEKWKSFSQNTA